MRRTLSVLSLFLVVPMLFAQEPSKPGGDSAYHPEPLSGMYSFLKEGEFVQIDFEEGSRLTGFISRYGDLDSDRGAFLDLTFSKGEYSGDKLSFTTKSVHGVWFEFKGRVSTDKTKQPGAEGYATIHGTLIEYNEDKDKKTSAKSTEVTFKSFPHDMTAP